jgi:hypothetical protein
MTHKLALETKMRDASASLKRFNSSRIAANHPSSRALERNGSIASNEERLVAAQARVDALSAELYALKQRETVIRTRLLRHTSAVLAAALRRHETGSAAPSQRSSLAPLTTNGTPRLTPSPPKADRAEVIRFDSAHFFANNREAVLPLSRSAHSSPSPAPAPAFAQIDPAEHAALRAEVAEHALKDDALRSELEAHAAEAERARTEAAAFQRDLATAQRSTSDAQRQLASLREDAASRQADGERALSRAQASVDGQRAAVAAVLRRHRAASHALATFVPCEAAATDDLAKAIDGLLTSLASHVTTVLTAREGASTDLSTARAEADAAARRANEVEATMQDLWRVLPAGASGLDIATDEPATLARAFKPLPRGGIEPGYTASALAERVRGLASDTRGLAERVEREASEARRRAIEVEGLRRSVEEAQRAAQTAQTQVRCH